MNSNTSHPLTIAEASRRAGNELLASIMSSYGGSPRQRSDTAQPAVRNGPTEPRAERRAAEPQSAIRTFGSAQGALSLSNGRSPQF